MVSTQGSSYLTYQHLSQFIGQHFLHMAFEAAWATSTSLLLVLVLTLFVAPLLSTLLRWDDPTCLEPSSPPVDLHFNS